MTAAALAALPMATYRGFRFYDQGSWRHVECAVCPKFTEFMNPTAERMEWIVTSHGCGDAGTPWSVGSSTPVGSGPAYEQLLRSVAEVVASQPVGSFVAPGIARAAGRLAEMLDSQLHAAGWVTVEQLVDFGVAHEAVGIAWGDWNQCAAHVAEDLRTGRLQHGRDPAELGRLLLEGSGFDPGVHCTTCARGVVVDDALNATRR